eukprot:2945804-Amphidinium_carterae.1
MAVALECVPTCSGRSDGGITALDLAAKHGFVENLELLLEMRADLEPRRADNGVYSSERKARK